MGNAEPFGLINIGDDAGFFSMAETSNAFDNERDDFGGALFGTLNNKDSTLNVLIGSRKFTEGWSSWRVATMGLLSGAGQGLNIFDVRASYMAAFKDYLREEGTTPRDEILDLKISVRANLPADKLKTLSLKDGYKDNQKLGFKRTHFPWLYEIPAQFKGKIKAPHVVLDLYPRVEALSTNYKGNVATAEPRQKCQLNADLFAVFDWDRIYLALQDYKLQRS